MLKQSVIVRTKLAHTPKNQTAHGPSETLGLQPNLPAASLFYAFHYSAQMPSESFQTASFYFP
ncbi:hypothetical protein LVJ78_01255 [Uruburuella suis]|uniref:Uncharacterized protein n=1 Tax=Uruburuella suis TaxID=252130 RepID=A0AAE9GXI5_9NEIS|nr:hypothetical protein [Uruburuella suis]UOO79688.1 hypothetical protein LVJ78_01255 [Uruburuella suis]